MKFQFKGSDGGRLSHAAGKSLRSRAARPSGARPGSIRRDESDDPKWLIKTACRAKDAGAAGDVFGRFVDAFRAGPGVRSAP